MVGTVGHGTSDLTRVAPDELCEVENLSIVLGLAFAIVVEHLFLVPAMDHGACHLDEIRALLGSRAYSAEIATGAVLSRSVSQNIRSGKPELIMCSKL